MTEETKRESFIFYRSFYEAIQDLPKENQLELYNAIAQYSLNFEESNLNGLSNTIFKLIKPQLDANNKRFINGKKGAEHGKKGAEHGKKGGRPKKETPLDVEKNPPKNPPNNNNNVNNNVNNNNNKLIVQNENHFEQFWTHYTPIETKDGRAVGKGGKKYAREEYKKQIKEYTHDQIMQGLKNYLTFCKEKGQLTLHAVRFLKKQTFLDEFNVIVKPPTEAEEGDEILKQYINSIKE